MKILAVVMSGIFVVLYAVAASAEIHVGVVKMESNNRKVTNVQPLRVDQPVFVDCRYCKPYEFLIKKRLKDAGYMVVEEGDVGAAARIVISASIYVNKNGDAVRLDAEDVTEEYAAQIPPALDKRFQGRRIGSARSILDTDIGVIHQGTLLTGSATGGVIMGILGAFGGRLLDQHLLNQKRVAGVADAFVEVALHDGNYLLGLNAAADTPETPGAILRTTFTRAVELLASGVPEAEISTNGSPQ